MQIVELPYSGKELSMLVLVPAEGKTLADIEKILSVDRILQWRERMTECQVQLFLPRFKSTWGAQSLKLGLLALGMRDAFDPVKADFSGMDGRPHWLYVSDVLHKAFVDVNEEGTEAAAATALLMAFGSEEAPPPPKLFRADRPFLFLIQENRTGSILFLGRVTDPTAP
ncbi:MAG: serpin family protein [Kiritimatiellia bacterium]